MGHSDEREVKMRTLRLALGSDDGKEILRDHMGQAKEFLVFDVSEDGEYVLVERRENTSPEEKGKHGLDRKRISVMDILKDCQVLVGGRMSPNFVKLRDNSKFQPIVSKIPDIGTFMRKLSEEFDRIYELVERRRRGERPKEIPTL